ncbi:MAG: RNA methyltransferase [Chitinophagaceae bacterium]
MLSKKEIKDIQSLSHKKARSETGLFVAEGPKIVSELIQIAPKQIQTIYAIEQWVAENKTVAATVLSDIELERISQLQTTNQVVAVVKQFESKEPNAGESFCLYLDTIQDPGNLGTIIRIADWFGIKDIVCSSDCVDLYNSKVVQATMASIARVNVYYDEEGIWLSKQQAPVYAATLGGNSIYEINKLTNGVLMIGNESKGLSDRTLAFATERITIPKKGAAESLNAAVATGIILSHLI